MNHWADDILDATTDEIGIVLANVKALVETIKAQDARIVELEATVANERGEGKPPCEGWEYEPLDHVWVLYTPQGGFYVEREGNGWTWDADHISSGRPLCFTARDAMRKASEMVKQ